MQNSPQVKLCKGNDRLRNLGPFDEKSEMFSDYAGRYQAFVAANDFNDEKKVNVFLKGFVLNVGLVALILKRFAVC